MPQGAIYNKFAYSQGMAVDAWGLTGGHSILACDYRWQLQSRGGDHHDLVDTCGPTPGACSLVP